MKALKEISAVTLLNLKSLPMRLGASSVIVIGIAGVVGVLVSILAMVAGLTGMMTSTGRPDRAIVIGTGSSFEVLSNLSREATRTVLDAPGIKRGADGKPVASVEALAIVRGVLKDGSPANLPLRGTGPEPFMLRPELRIVEGRTFEPAVRELIVGRSAQRQFRGLDVGSTITLRGADWSVVGVFESNGDQHEAELITGAETLQSAFRRSAFQSVAVQLESEESFADFSSSLSADPSLSVDVMREPDYYRQQSRSFTRVLSMVAYLVGGIMGLGAVLGALNTMYSAVAERSREIAVLRALGFRGSSVVFSFLAESMWIALVGGVLGCLLALPVNGITTGTINWQTFSHLAFAFRITPDLLALGLLFAVFMGLVGGLPPAIRAARANVSTTLRAL